MTDPLRDEEAAEALRKGLAILLGVLVIYGTLTILNGGLVWPFNVSLTGPSPEQSWTRALVREVPSHHVDRVRWRAVSLNDLPGHAVALDEYHLSQKDVAKHVASTSDWTEERRSDLRRLLGSALRPGRALLLYRVRGRLDKRGEVAVTCTPVAVLSPDTLVASPNPAAQVPSK